MTEDILEIIKHLGHIGRRSSGSSETPALKSSDFGSGPGSGGCGMYEFNLYFGLPDGG